MESGYQIEWTENALNELEKTISYLKKNWTEKELKKLADSLDNTLELISRNPLQFQQSISHSNIRRVVVRKYNTLYYTITDNSKVEILSFFNNRQNPNKRKL